MNDARAQCVRVLSEAGVPVEVIAEGLGLSKRTVCTIRRKAGVVRINPVMEPLPGEVWIDRDDLGVRVSSQGRFASLKTGRLLSTTKGKYTEYVTVKTGTPDKTTIIAEYLVADTFGHSRRARKYLNPYSSLEDSIIKRSATLRDAVAALPTRSLPSVKSRAKRLKKKFSRPLYIPTETAKGSVPYLHPLYERASAAVPRGMPEDVRDDLISDLMLMALEGDVSDMRAAFKTVLKERNRMMGTYKERSLDGFIGGTDLRLIDIIASDREHF